MKNKLYYCNLGIIFQTKCKLINFFTFKDKIFVFFRSGCNNAIYYGKTEVRILRLEYVNTLGPLLLLERELKGINDSVIKNIILFCFDLALTIFLYQPATTMTSKLR